MFYTANFYNSKFNARIVFVNELIGYNLHAVAVILDGLATLQAVEQTLQRIVKIRLVALEINIGVQLKET